MKFFNSILIIFERTKFFKKDDRIYFMSKKEEFLKKVEAGNLTGDDILLLLDVWSEFGLENEEVIELLEDLDEEDEKITINFIVEELRGTVKIEGKKLITKHELGEKPDITVKMSKDVAKEIISGKLAILDGYKQEKLKAEGQIIKAAGLAILLNIMGDELGIL